MSKPSLTPEVSLEEEQSFYSVKGRAPSRASENVQHQMKNWQQLDAHQKHTQHREGRDRDERPNPTLMSSHCRAEN